MQNCIWCFTEMNYYYLLHYDTWHIDSDSMRFKKKLCNKKNLIYALCVHWLDANYSCTPAVCIILGTLKITLMKTVINSL